MERKTAVAELKDLDERGRGTAVISTTGVVDADGDLVEPGAFGRQRVVFLRGHDWQSNPLGHAEIHEKGNKAIADLELNLTSSEGREAHSWLKWDHERGGLQEFSYGFSIAPNGVEVQRLADGRTIRRLKSLRVHEVSMVVKGAGVGTGLVAIKGDLAARTAEVVAEYHRLRERGAALEEHLAKLDGQVSYRYIDMTGFTLLDPRRHLAREVVFHAAKALGIPAPQIRFFTTCDEDRADFTDEPMWGYSRKGDHIAIEWSLSPDEMVQVVAHEVGHHAGLEEAEASEFGRRFVTKHGTQFGTAPRHGGHWSYEQAAAAAMAGRHLGMSASEIRKAF